MNSSYSEDEFEEVESPFARVQSPSRENLRKKPLFQRQAPLNTTTSQAPTVVEALSYEPAAHLDETDIDYLDEEENEEEEIEERRPVRANPQNQLKKKKKQTEKLLIKIGWAFIALSFLRLVFMDRGVVDYYSMEGQIQEKQKEFQSIKKENADLRFEITRIQNDISYQKQLAKEHLGVIGAGEFLILFAGDSEKNSNEVDLSI